MRKFVAVTVVVGIASLAVLSGCKKEETAGAPAGMKESTPAQEIAQKTCPVIGGAINEDIYLDYEGRRVYFCCAACVEAFKKEPEKYLGKLDEQLESAKSSAVERMHEKHEEH